MKQNVLNLPVVKDLLENPYQLQNVLTVYSGVLKEQKNLHEGNCPDCEQEQKPCKRYYWLMLNIQEVEWSIQKLDQETKK